MNVLSLFDGMSCGQQALERVGIKVDNYFASEIDKHAIRVTQNNYPNTIQLGSVINIKGEQLPQIDILIGGSPCQGFSFAGKQLNFEDTRSKLFFEYVRILNDIREYNPDVKFLLENVKMKKEYENVISDLLKVKPIEINSNLVSAQNRKRLYWTNIEGVVQPEDKKIFLKDILEQGVDDSYYVSQKQIDKYLGGNQLNPEYKSQANTIHENKFSTVCAETHGYSNGYVKITGCDFRSDEGFRLREGGKTGTLSARARNDESCGQLVKIDNAILRLKSKCVRSSGLKSDDRHEWDAVDNTLIRRLTPLECERLQTLPDNYTQGVSNSQRYKMIGNGWTIDVIAHIFKNLRQLSHLNT